MQFTSFFVKYFAFTLHFFAILLYLCSNCTRITDICYDTSKIIRKLKICVYLTKGGKGGRVVAGSISNTYHSKTVRNTGILSGGGRVAGRVI